MGTATTVRLRQALDEIGHRIFYVPIVGVVIAIALAGATLYLDRQIGDDRLPAVLETSVDSGRAILTSIAGGLIASITLLLSMMLIVVQLAGSQYSPRTTRDWLGDRAQQWAIGLVLGATVYCLLVLRGFRSTSDGETLTPHVSIMVALVFGVASLLAVVRSVDHLANGVRIGAVASRITDETVALIRSQSEMSALEHPRAPSAEPRKEQSPEAKWPETAVPICATESGWIQQISEESILAALPEGSTAHITGVIGGFTLPDAPVMWVWPDPADGDVTHDLIESIAVGDTRTMQQDVGFGVLRLVDIAVRALSPGVNDPNTANDVIAHLGVISLALLELPEGSGRREERGRVVIRREITHADYLHSAFDPIRRYGTADPTVVLAMIKTLSSLRSEVKRRDLPCSTKPLDEMIDGLRNVSIDDISERDRAEIAKAADQR